MSRVTRHMWLMLDPSQREQLLTYTLVLRRAGVPHGLRDVMVAQAYDMIFPDDVAVQARVGEYLALYGGHWFTGEWRFGKVLSVSRKRGQLNVQLYPTRESDFTLHKPLGGITYVATPDWDAKPDPKQRARIRPYAHCGLTSRVLRPAEPLRTGESKFYAGEVGRDRFFRAYTYDPRATYHALCRWTYSNPFIKDRREPRDLRCHRCTQHVPLPWVKSHVGIRTTGKMDSVPSKPDDWEDEE